MKRRVLFLVFFALVIFFGYVWHIGAWNLIFPKNSHDSIEPELPKFLNQPSVLVFSKTNQFRHKDSITSGQAYFSELTSSKGIGVFLTENGASFNPGTLANFDVVVFLNVTGDSGKRRMRNHKTTRFLNYKTEPTKYKKTKLQNYETTEL